MSYTFEAFHINGKFPDKERKVFSIWRNFCLKNPPVPILGQGSLSHRLEKISEYYNKYFLNNLCFLGNTGRIVVFGHGKLWLDDPNVSLPEGKIAVAVMGASEGETKPYDSMMNLREVFRLLKENYGYDIVAWNLNREFRRKPFERLMKKLGGKQIGDCYYVQL